MKLRRAIVATLRSKRFWAWELGGAFIYAIPVAIRYITGDVVIPFLNFPGFWIYHIIPGNMLEKVLVNAFFPGGAGGVAGEILVSNRRDEALMGRAKYLARLGGALGQTAVWSLFQFWGYFLLISGPSGKTGSNLFESVFVFPINFVLAALSIFTPEVLNFVKWSICAVQRIANREIKKIYRRISGKHS
jgi:hypothetical protein